MDLYNSFLPLLNCLIIITYHMYYMFIICNNKVIYIVNDFNIKICNIIHLCHNYLFYIYICTNLLHNLNAYCIY